MTERHTAPNATPAPAAPASDDATDAARARALLAHGTDLIAILDAGGVFRYASPAYERILGYDPAALIGTNSFALIHPDDAEAVQTAFARVFTGGAPVTVAFRYRHASGTWCEIEATGNNYLDDPAVRGVVVNSREISDRRAAARGDDILTESPIAICLWEGPEHRYAFANPAYLRVVGGRAVLGRTLLDALPELRGQDVPALIERVRTTGAPYEGHDFFVLLDRHGTGQPEDCYFDFTYLPARDVRGAVTGVYCYATDVTARVQTQRRSARLTAERDALLLSEQAAHATAERERARLIALFTEAPAAIAILRGPDLIYDFANPRYCQVVGRDDLLGKPGREALPELVAQGTWDIFDHVYATGEPFRIDEYHVHLDRRGDGTLDEGYFAFAIQPYRDAAGAVAGLLLHAVEMTDQVRARQAAERASAELNAIVDAIPEAVFVSDGRRITRVNDSGARIFGFADRAAFLQDIGDLERRLDARYDGARAVAANAPLARAFAGETGVIEGTARPLGATKEIATRVAFGPVRDARGAVIASVAVVSDITAQADLARVREEFLTAAAHDLRSPLTGISGYAQLAARRLGRLPALPEVEAHTASIARALAQIETAATRMLTLINEMLDIARLRLGQGIELSRAPTDLVALTREIIDIARAATPHPLALIAPDALIAPVDAARIERVIANLVANAQKYSDPATTVAVQIGRAGDDAVIAVIDRGIGIPAADLPHIFERFQRAGNVGVRDGSGVGLASALQIVEAHGGTLTVESAEGHGSTFTVRLPLGDVRGMQ